MKAKRLTIFMFGYWNWGNATAELIRAVDAVEKQRGFGPPVFVDIRIRRVGKAKGFIGSAFEKAVGPSRHYRMGSLGNMAMLPGSPYRDVKIKSPKAVNELIDIAIDRGKRKQRVIYFCACMFPCDCHRYTVAELLIKAAKRSRIALEVVEWPGGEPTTLGIKVADGTVPKDDTPRLHLSSARPLAKYAGLAAGSLVTVTGTAGQSRTVAVAPAMFAPKGWYLPILRGNDDKVIPGTKRAARGWREECGYLPLRT